MQSHKAVSAYFTSKQILPFGFVWQYSSSSSNIRQYGQAESVVWSLLAFNSSNSRVCHVHLWSEHSLFLQPNISAERRQTTVTAYFESKQLLLSHGDDNIINKDNEILGIKFGGVINGFNVGLVTYPIVSVLTRPNVMPKNLDVQVPRLYYT